MTDRTSTRKDYSPAMGGKVVVLKSTTSATASDTMTMTLSAYGITNVLAVEGFIHDTDLSVIVADSQTTAVSGDTLTVTTTSSTAYPGKRRVFIVYGE